MQLGLGNRLMRIFTIIYVKSNDIGKSKLKKKVKRTILVKLVVLNR